MYAPFNFTELSKNNYFELLPGNSEIFIFGVSVTKKIIVFLW